MIPFLLTWKEALFFTGALVVVLTPWSKDFRWQLLLGLFIYLLNKPLIANFHPGEVGWWLEDPAAWITAATWVGAVVTSLFCLKGIKGQGVWNALLGVSWQPHLIAFSLIVLAIFLFNLVAISPQFKVRPDYSFVILIANVPMQYFIGLYLLKPSEESAKHLFSLVVAGVLLFILSVSFLYLHGAVSEYRALLKIPPTQRGVSELIGRWESLLERNTVPSIGAIRVTAYGRIGDLKLSLGDLEGARQGYKKALREAPDDVTGSIGLARLLIRSGISEKAREALKKVIDYHPFLSWERLAELFPPLQFQEIWILAAALEAEGRQEEAFRAYREAWQIQPEDPLVNLGLGRIYLARGDYEEAIGAFKKTLARLPRHLYALSSLIDTHEQEGRQDLAQHYREIILRDMVTHRIRPSEWRGKAGGNLYWNKAGCHAQVTLLRGRVLFTIQARGTPARGIWPHMVVMLDKEVIGEADVTSAEWKPYSFTKDVQTGEYLLWVYFTNDLCLVQERDGKKVREDRNLFVGAVEMTSVR